MNNKCVTDEAKNAFRAGFGTFHKPKTVLQVAGLRRASPSTTLDKIDINIII